MAKKWSKLEVGKKERTAQMNRLIPKNERTGSLKKRATALLRTAPGLRTINRKNIEYEQMNKTNQNERIRSKELIRAAEPNPDVL